MEYSSSFFLHNVVPSHLIVPSHIHPTAVTNYRRNHRPSAPADERCWPCPRWGDSTEEVSGGRGGGVEVGHPVQLWSALFSGSLKWLVRRALLLKEKVVYENPEHGCSLPEAESAQPRNPVEGCRILPRASWQHHRIANVVRWITATLGISVTAQRDSYTSPYHARSAQHSGIVLHRNNRCTKVDQKKFYDLCTNVTNASNTLTFACSLISEQLLM